MNLRIHFFVMAFAAGCALFCPGAVAGPHFDQVGLLLPFDGTHGATSTTDVSHSAHSPAFHGNAKISAGRSKFGGTSCYFDGKGDFLTVADSEDWNFGTGDFTIEFWVLRTGVSKYEGILGESAASWNSGAPVIVIYNTKILITEGEFANKTQASTSFIANTWYHVAFSRGGGFMRLFVNGKLEGFAVDNHSYDFNEIRIGRYNVGADYDFGGYLDDLRITKGVARYPSNFALPDAMSGDAVPTITLLTESMTVAEGGSVNLSVTAVGALPLAYQWSKGGVEMSGATQSTLTLADVALSDAGVYSVAVTNSVGAVDSETITVTVLKPAGIDVQPEGGSAILGGDFTLKVVASGTEPISYQWHHKGAILDGETKSTLSLTRLRAADMGSYHVVVSNEGGEETSNSVNLSMLPTITKLTESMTPVKGEDVELSVTAAGTAPLTYQWYHSGTLIEGATSTTLFLTNFQTGDSGDYHVVVTNAEGSVTSDMVALLVPPTITRLTNDVSVIEGDTLKLSVTAVGTPPISYQWSKDDEEIPGAITPELTLAETKASDAGIYTVEVQNASGRIGPFKVTVIVLQPARIVTQPVGGRAYFGEAFAFEVVAEGTEPITYEWYQGGALLGESTGSSLSLADLIESDAGEYHVVVSNERTTDTGETVSFGKETSETVTLTVVVPPENVQLSGSLERGLDQLSATVEVTGDEEEPKTYSWSESGVLAKGDTVVLTATATGSEPFVYEWYHDGSQFDGETVNTLRLAKVQDLESGEYQVVVANEAGSETSEPMTLEVKPAGTIVELAGSVTVVEGEKLEFDVTAAGKEPLTYEWTKDGAVIDGATTTGYIVDNVTQAAVGEYKLAVKREEALLGFAAITVAVAAPPVIVTQPLGGSADLDDTFHFEVAVAGAEPITYEWYHEGEVVGEQSFLQLTDVQAEDAGDYHVVVSNIAGEVSSDTVALELVLPPEITQLSKSREGPTVDLSATAEVTGGEEEPTTYQWEVEGAILEGDNVELTVSLTGTEPISYQWVHGEETVEGGTESTLRLTDVQGVDSGDYYVVVSNKLGTEYSDVITLSVVPPPAVTELAGSITVVEGEGVELSVTAVSNESLTYQWSKGEEAVGGATASALDLGNVEASAEADYRLTVKRDGTLVGSAVITVALAVPPVIVAQPQGGSADLEDTFKFEVVAEGTEPITYEWHHDGEVVGEQRFLQLTDVQAANAGEYHVIVTNIAGEVTSETVVLTVNSPPVITQLTKSREGPAVDLTATAEVTGDEAEPKIFQWSKEGAILEGDNVELTVTLTGSEPISYQWYQGEELIEEGKASTLRLTDVQAEDSGVYRVVVSNQLGTEISEVITLSVVPPPAVTELAETINVLEGEGVELSVTAVSNESPTYQWSMGEEVMVGATAPTLDLGDVKVSSEADYRLAISNAEGLVGLVVITLAMADPPVIVTQPQGGSADAGEAFTFEVVAEGTGLEYEWHKGGTPEVLDEFKADWDDGEEVEGTSLAGATQIKDGSLHITEAANGKSGGFTVSDFTDGGTFTDFEISFRLYMTDSTCCGNGDDTSASHRPADGLSISIGNDLPDTIRLAEEGAGEGIRICFDTWDSGGGEAPAIDVWRGPDSDGPTVYIPLDDIDRDRAVGLVGNPGLIYINGPELGVSALNPNGAGTAVRFDGSKDQALRVKNHPDINITRGPWEERTWEFWFKAEQLPAAGQHQVLYEEGAHVRGISIYLTGTGDASEADLYMMAWNRAETRWGGKLNQRGGEGISTVKTTIKVDEVYHLAFVMDGDPSGNMEGTLAGYLNGKKIGEVSGVHLLYNHSGNIAFGNKWGTTVTHEGNSWGSGGMGFTGVIDDASFYSVALSEEQIVDHFENFGVQDIWPGGMVARQNFNGVTSALEEAKFKDADGDYVWMWTQGEWADVKVLFLDGNLKVNFKGHEVISEKLPPSWKPLEGPEWLFAARTGGANQTHWIDDLKIKIFADAVSTANSALVAEATGSTLPLTELEGEDAGDYYVVVSNIAGEVTSDTATLAVDLPPTVTQLSASSNADGLDLSATAEVAGEEPLTYEWSQNGSFLAGGDIDLVATMSGTEPISYQWVHNDLPIDGAAGNTLRLAKAGVDASGDYHVMASNRLATVTSDTLAIAVVPATTATELAGSVSVYEGETIELSVTASGLSPLAYEWSLGDTILDGATSATLSLSNLEAEAAGDYKLAIRHEDRLVGQATISVIVPAARVVTQPVGGSVGVGGSHTFEVVATGSEPINYRWFHEGTLIEEATGSTLTLEGLTGDDAGGYHVEVTNETLPWGGTDTSATANLVVLIPLAITHLTDSKLEGEGNWQWALQGGTIDLSVTAEGTPPLSYQWTKDGGAIEGATGPGMTLANLEEDDAGLYTVKVSNATEQLESDPFKVVILTATTAQPAKIVLQPEAVSATLGETAELSVYAEGSEPISYQWYFAGEPIEDGTERVLSIPDVQKADAGEYHVVVSNDGYPWGATETSDTAALTIESPPVITKLTESMTVLRGDTIELSVTATGDEPLSYQWSKGGTEVEGATGSNLTLADASQSDAGDYTVTVSNAVSEVVSNVVSVTMPEPVRIVTQPQDVFAVAGASATMTVVVEGSEPIEYYWMHDAKWVDGGRGSTLSLSNLQAKDFGAYNVLVRNATGIVISEPAMLTVMSPPEITQLTESLTLIQGESVELTVTADGHEPLAYQWSKGGEAIDGATAPTLRLAKVAPTAAGDYSVSVSNAAGEAESGVVTVKVIEPVTIVTQPEGATAIVGDTVMLQVVAEGTEPITYYWYHDGERVDGATESTLRLAKVQAADSGSYNVIMQNSGGTAISEIADLIVLLPPEITQLTESLTVIEGESVELTVAALGSEPLAYQWRRGGEAIDGATAPTLRLAKVAPTAAGDYSVIVSNAAGEAESGVVTVKVIEPVTIVTQPKGATAILGDTVTLQVVANGTAPITYAWYHDGERVDGATESTLRLAKVQAADSGVYHLVASNSGGTAKSKIAGLVVVLPPEITQLTESLSVMERDSVELSVAAVGSEPLAYQWSRDGVELEGATAPTLSLIRVAPAAAGDYTVVARNAAGQMESNAITVDVVEPIRIVTQPEGANATLEDTVTLRVVAEGTEPINYFWLHNGRPVEGGRQSTLTLTELEAGDAGEYVVMVSNIGGQATSETAHLSVELPEGAYLVEDFDGLTLGPWNSGDDPVGDGSDWTATPPAGWTAERGAGHEPAASVEFDGWTFVDPVSWQKTAGPERDQFTKGSGVIAVADSAHTGGESDAKFSATMATPTIDIAGAEAGSLVLTYDSSWREAQRKRVFAAFEEDFEGDDVGEGVTIAGTAVQALQYVRTGGAWPWLKLNGILKVTDAVYSQSGGMLINDFSNGAAFNEFEISFRLFMGRGTRRPADGLSVSIGNDLPTLAYPAEEGVSDAAFRVCFDAWDSGGGEAPAIEIFNGKKSVAIQKFHGQTAAADSEKFVTDDGDFLMMWHKSEWTDVNIRVADGLATVNFRGHDVIRDTPIDLSPIKAAQFLFAARTGGAHQKHYIDDIKIRLFDSSRSRVTVAYDDGAPVTLLELNSRTPTAYDETVSLKLNNPTGAQTAVVAWDYQGHDNWWEVDNITVATDAEPEPTLAGLATDRDRYVLGEPIKVSFNDGPGNQRDWIGIYRPDMAPGEHGSLAWVYVNGSPTPGDALSEGSVIFTNNLPVGSYVARYFKNDGYGQLADAASFTVVIPPGVATDRPHYAPGEPVTVHFNNGPGDPADWISLMPLGETSSIDWAYVGGTRTVGDGLANGGVTFADGLPEGEYRVIFLANDGYRQLAKAEFIVAGQVAPPPLGFANNGDGTITLTFEGRLQTAPTINGPWQDMDATSPVTLPTDQRQRFTRSVK